jgi:hypothetical protein
MASISSSLAVLRRDKIAEVATPFEVVSTEPSLFIWTELIPRTSSVGGAVRGESCAT